LDLAFDGAFERQVLAAAQFAFDNDALPNARALFANDEGLSISSLFVHGPLPSLRRIESKRCRRRGANRSRAKLAGGSAASMGGSNPLASTSNVASESMPFSSYGQQHACHRVSGRTSSPKERLPRYHDNASNEPATGC